MEEIISRAARGSATGEAGEDIPVLPKPKFQNAAKLRALAPKHGKVSEVRGKTWVCNFCSVLLRVKELNLHSYSTGLLEIAQTLLGTWWNKNICIKSSSCLQYVLYVQSADQSAEYG